MPDATQPKIFNILLDLTDFDTHTSPIHLLIPPYYPLPLDVVDKNYDKSFDHRSFYFRQQDKRVYTAKVCRTMMIITAPSFCFY